ncbi:MAG: RdgB/HAM1 family non-canonical purine NTP pyrophosphatase [Synergistaceae bacterium]|nr:RdgB/HAM1 family non-canonical purine NTP pyrophosphatase [Synergistaceae bacterium]
MIKELLLATTNKGKYKEFEFITGRKLIFAPEIADLIVEETGKTYSENAMLKAKTWAEKSGLPCLADDSGLEVEALDGAPGLYSARIVPGKDENKISWLLSKLEGNKNRNARFVASLALCVPDEFILICEGFCYGKISEIPKGLGGFGYDPVFIPDRYEKTFAELGFEIKNSISHRANAFKKMKKFFDTLNNRS